MNITFYSEKCKNEYFLIPICANYTHIRRGVNSLPHIHPVYHLMFVTDGTGVLENDSSSYPLQEKDIFVIHPNEKHILSTDHEEGMRYFTFNFYILPKESYECIDIIEYWTNPECQKEIEDTAELARLDDLFGFKLSNIYFKFDKTQWVEITSFISSFSGTMKKYYVNLIDEWRSRPSWNEKKCFDAFSRFFWDFYAILSRLELHEVENKDEEMLLNRIIDYLQKNVNKKYSLPELASHLKYHPVYLCTYFRQKMGMTINQYFNKLKIYEASKYLRTTDKSITEIAYLLNFSSSNHFSRNFIKEKNITPRDYRKNLEAR